MNTLLFLRDMGLAPDKHRLAEYKCSCGNIFIAMRSRVKTGLIFQCPECSRKLIKIKNTKHGGKGTPTYSSWQAMKARCLNKTNKDYPRWGGKGITICKEWIDSYSAFRDYMGERPANMTIDRIDNSKGYEPGNVRWATALMQGENRRNILFIEWHGKPTRVKDIANELGLSIGAVHLRYKRGKLYEPK
jgi:DNA-directed RNA polymerase subunit RPC12/RpoP